MLENHFDFRDYVDLRERVWRHLPSGRAFILHLVIFVVAVTILLLEATYRPRGGQPYLYFVNPDVSKGFVLWAIVIALHGLIVWWRSGLRAGQRSTAVDFVINNQYQADTTLTEMEFFLLHRLLSEDVQRNAKVLSPALWFAFLNALVWTISGAINLNTSLTWQVTPFASLPFLVWMIVIALGRKTDENRHFPSQRQPKQKNEKRKLSDHWQSEDGELIDFPEVKLKHER